MENLKEDFENLFFWSDGCKRQGVYLSPDDTKIAFNESKHLYLLPAKKLTFGTSVTGFCKTQVHGSEFDPASIIRNMQFEDCDIDMHCYTLIEWKYASLFGSLFHAMVEYFFQRIVNGCNHEECKRQTYDEEAYKNAMTFATNNYYHRLNIDTQCFMPDPALDKDPVLPCQYSLRDYSDFVKTIVEPETFKQFFDNNLRFNVKSEFNMKSIRQTMEEAFVHNQAPLKYSVRNYRKEFNDGPDFDYYNCIYAIIEKHFGVERYRSDLEQHLCSFRNVLRHMPIADSCDIYPEYIAYSEEHGLAGSVDLIMRNRYDPFNLLVYDWKTCKKIFNSFRRNDRQTNQLLDYSCQLHTYANMMYEKDPSLVIELFVVNVTATDSCIYNVKSFEDCSLCRDKYKYFKCAFKQHAGDDEDDEKEEI